MYQGIATKVLTGEVRLDFVHLEQPYANPKTPGAEAKYSVTLYIPKTDTATKADLDAAMAAAYEKGVREKWNGNRPQMRNAIIYDGDGVRPNGSAFGEAAKGCWVMTASSKSNIKPQVVDISNINVELAPQDVYSGMYARVTLNFFPYAGQSMGVGAGLGNVMKTRDGEALGGGASAASDFAGIGQAAGAVAPATPAAAAQAPYQQPIPQYTQPQAPQPAYAPGVTPQGYNPGQAAAPQASAPQINPITGLPM